MKKEGVVLKKGKETIFENRHLWIFSGAIESYPPHFIDGHIYPIYSADSLLLGHGYFHSKLSLAGRILSFGSEEPLSTLKAHLQCAYLLRKNSFDHTITDSYRICHGEGDMVPGLVIDQYGEYLVLQSNTLGIDLLKKEIVDFLISIGKWKGIFEKSAGSSRREEGLDNAVGVLYGEEKEEILIRENGLSFYVNWKTGQKTGFFLDQREMRQKIKNMAHGKKVLNCFSYTGGFSIYALSGGARQVDSLDVSKEAMNLCKRNVTANGFSHDHCRFLEEDAFAFLAKAPLDYDLIILDPPAFAKKRGDKEQASKGYREINLQALTKMPKGSFLLTCSCSYYIDEALFQTLIFQAAKKTGREVQIISKHIAALDHPVNLFHPESHYLKSLLLFVN